MFNTTYNDKVKSLISKSNDIIKPLLRGLEKVKSAQESLTITAGDIAMEQYALATTQLEITQQYAKLDRLRAKLEEIVGDDDCEEEDFDTIAQI